MKKFNVAILGAGNIARDMATALAGIKDRVNLYAVASRSLEKAEAFAEKWGFGKAYGSYEELAKDDDVDLVYVATPHSEHFANAYLLLENGRNILVEKAFTGNRTQAEKLVKLAKEKGVYLAEAMWTRYMPSKNVIKDLMDSGIIGEAMYLESDFSIEARGVERLTNPALAGGALLDLGIYSITVPAMYFGTDVVKVNSSVEKYETGVDSTDVITMTYADGKMARCKCSFVSENSNYAKIVGELGYIRFEPINVPVKVEVFNNEGKLLKSLDTSPSVNGYEYEVLEAIDQIAAGKLEPVSLPHAESLKMMGWMDSIRNHAGIVYPFETKADIDHPDKETWGGEDVFDDVNPWDRSNTKSYLEVYDIESGEITTLAAFDKVIEAPNWSHNGEFLAYNSEGKIFTFDLATKESKMVDSGELCKINNDHVLSTDDKEIAVSDETLLDGKSRIYRINIASGEVTNVTKEAPSYLHGWTPDGSKFAYCAERGGEYDVYECKLDGSEEKQLTTAPCLNDGCEYDSTGEYIYFNSVRAGLMQAFRMKADGSEQTQLTFDKNLNTWFPHISPDGKKIVMISYYKGDLWPGDHVPNKYVEIRLMNSDMTDLKTIIKLFGGQGTINVNSWSPDSKKFAYVRYER